MTELFRYEKYIFVKPNINNAEIQSTLLTKKRTFTKEIKIDWFNNYQEDITFKEGLDVY